MSDTKKVTTSLYELIEFLMLIEAKESAAQCADKNIKENLKNNKAKRKGISSDQRRRAVFKDELNAPSKIKKCL